MDTTSKFKDWVNENAPMLNSVYQNKYIGMLYDRFASLPPKQQKQLVYGAFLGTTTIVVGYLLFSYFSLWSNTNSTKQAYAMTNMLVQYQKFKRSKTQQIQALTRNAPLANGGQFKQYLTDLGKTSSISPRMVEVTEKPDSLKDTATKATTSDVKIKQASVTLQRVNLTQMTTYIKNIEYGQYALNISSVKITNDEKLRGFMRVELNVLAYIFETAEGS